MAEEKEMLLEELYGLRAGLSVYSEEAENVTQIEDASWIKEKELIDAVPNAISYHYPYPNIANEAWLLYKEGYPVMKQLCDEYHLDWKKFNEEEFSYFNFKLSELDEEVSEWNLEQYHISEKVYERWLISDEMKSGICKQYIDKKKEELKKPAESYLCRCLKKLIFPTILLVAALVAFFIWGLNSDSNLLKYGLLALVGVFGILFIRVGFSCLSRLKSIHAEKKEVRKLEKAIEHPESAKEIQNAYAACNRLKTLVAEREEKTYPYVIKLDNLYKASQKEYASTLDERNWKHLDLVIFALETGRADTLKEALQFVDGETRTRRIEKAIETATSQICSTIRSGFASLENTIQACCNKLSAQIQDIGGKILATNQQILSTQREMLTEQRFTNALLAKANVSSAQLMEDVHRMRNNSDYINMRLRNG